MTGEITLRGRVLPIGGLKDKVLAAHRAGVQKVIFPAENKKDLKEIPKKVLKVMEMLPVDHVDEVLRLALAVPEPEKFLPGPSASVDWRAQPAGSTGATAAGTAPATAATAQPAAGETPPATH
jgi:ATP-dependent Lon protease